jgi:uncharacterized cupredoxin-like copper-binding protein
MFKRCAAVVGALATAGVLAAIATAQTPVPTVAVTASPSSVTTQTTPIAPGPTTFQITRQASRTGLSVYFALLNQGSTIEDLRAAFRRDDRTRGDSSLGLASIQASLSFSGNQTSRPVTFTLKPGQTYVMVSQPDSENAPPTRGISTFTTSTTANGATAPTGDATIRMVDLRFQGATTLPRRGTVRVQNFGGVPHIAIAFPLRSGVTTAQLGRALSTNNERALGRVLAGEPTEVQNLISGGGASDVQTVSFSRTGRYGLVCFFNEHHRLGMYRIVNVR